MAKSIYDEYPELHQKLLDEVRKGVEDNKLKGDQVKKVLDRVRDSFESSKISPGEAIGIVTAESIGEPGTQMSLSKNERIIIKIKDRIKIVRIGEFLDGLMNANGAFSFNNTEILPLNDYELYVPSINQEEKIEWKKVVECSRHKCKKNLMKLTTSSGREITATDNHSFVVRKDNQIVPIMGKILNVGDRIPVIKYLPEHCIKEIKTSDYIKISENSRFKLIEDNGLLFREKTHSKRIPDVIKLDNKFGWFIGAYLAEGNATNGQVSLSNMDDNFMNNAKEFVSFLNLRYKEEYNQRGFSLSRDLKINSSLLANFLINSCKTGSAMKIVPEFAYSAEEEFVSGLLKGYFDGDANFHVSGKMIRVSSNSRELRDGIALLLNRFNIFSYKTEDNQYWLLIPYKYAPLFLQYIGSDIEYKREDLEKLAGMARKFWNETSQDYTDMISGFGNLFYDTAKKVGMSTRYVNNFTKRQKIGRTALFRYIKKFELLSKENNVDISNELVVMNRMFNSDVVWDAIEKIEQVQNDGFVYDLSVPGLETFTTFEGVITHNTLNVFHFAGVAEVAVTLGLPRLIELLDARKEPSTPRIEVHLDKEIAKDPVKVKKVAATIKETKLAEVVDEFSVNMSQSRIEIYLNKQKMKDFVITEAQLVKTIGDSLKNIDVRANKDFISIKLKAEQFELKELYQLREKVRELHTKGVKGIKQVLPIKRDNEYIIICVGNNLKDVMNVEGVDFKKTVTNDVFMTQTILGVEAARQAIMNEAIEVIENQGLDIDIRHIMLLADVMTSVGSIKGITRSGITGEKESVLARASFETPIKHIVNATLKGEEDKLNSVIENVMLNQEIPVGTGLPSLIAKIRDMKK